MHVDKNNLDQFIALMNTQYSQQQHNNDDADESQQQLPKRRGTMMQKVKASIRRGGTGADTPEVTKTQGRPTPAISGPSDLRKTDGVDISPTNLMPFEKNSPVSSLPAAKSSSTSSLSVAPPPRPSSTSAKPSSPTASSQKPQKKKLIISGPSDARPLNGNNINTPPTAAPTPSKSLAPTKAAPPPPQRPPVRRPTPPKRPLQEDPPSSSKPPAPPSRPSAAKDGSLIKGDKNFRLFENIFPLSYFRFLCFVRD